MRIILFCLLSLFFVSVKAQRQNSNTQQNVYYWFYKGYKAVENGNYQEAIANYTRAINLDSSFSEAYRYRGIARCYAKNYYEAIPDFDIAGAQCFRGIFKMFLIPEMKTSASGDEAEISLGLVLG